MTWDTRGKTKPSHPCSHRRTKVVPKAQVLLVNLEPDFRGVVVSCGAVVDRHHEALGLRETAGQRRDHVVRKRGDLALAGKVVTDEGNLADFGILHAGQLRAIRPRRQAQVGRRITPCSYPITPAGQATATTLG